MDELMKVEPIEAIPVIEEEVAHYPDEREVYVKGLRDMAAWIETHPEIKLPMGADLQIHNIPTDELPVVAKAMGKAQKHVLLDAWFFLTRTFGPHKIEANWTRAQVCERVVVGTETVEEPVMVQQGTKSVTREKVEWKCPKITAPKLEA